MNKLKAIRARQLLWWKTDIEVVDSLFLFTFKVSISTIALLFRKLNLCDNPPRLPFMRKEH